MNFGQNVMVRDPLRAQGFKTQRPESPEDLWQPLYDRVHYAAAGAAQLAFFAVPKGQAATLVVAGAAVANTIKTYRDTNIDNANVVPTKLFRFEGISLGFCHEDEGDIANPTDRDNIRTGSYFKFRIVDKDILFLPTVCVPEINPYVIGSTGTAATMLGSAAAGGKVPYYRFPVPITLNPYENFNVELNFTGTVTTTKAVDIYVIMHAYMRRPT